MLWLQTLAMHLTAAVQGWVKLCDRKTPFGLLMNDVIGSVAPMKFPKTLRTLRPPSISYPQLHAQDNLRAVHKWRQVRGGRMSKIITTPFFEHSIFFWKKLPKFYRQSLYCLLHNLPPPPSMTSLINEQFFLTSTKTIIFSGILHFPCSTTSTRSIFQKSQWYSL